MNLTSLPLTQTRQPNNATTTAPRFQGWLEKDIPTALKALDDRENIINRNKVLRTQQRDAALAEMTKAITGTILPAIRTQYGDAPEKEAEVTKALTEKLPDFFIPPIVRNDLAGYDQQLAQIQTERDRLKKDQKR